MEKDFDRWNKAKKSINEREKSVYFYEREVRWCLLGVNVGFEQDGKKRFDRPVLILKKFNQHACLIVPLTTKEKVGMYYFPLGKVAGENATATLSQLRFIDSKRLDEKIHTLDSKIFETLMKTLVEEVLSYKNSLPAITGGEQVETICTVSISKETDASQ